MDLQRVLLNGTELHGMAFPVNLCRMKDLCSWHLCAMLWLNLAEAVI